MARDWSHLHALEEGLAREKTRLGFAKTKREKLFREVQVSQLEKEIKGEKLLLGLADLPDMSDDELLAALIA
jgi:hypothetical protein